MKVALRYLPKTLTRKDRKAQYRMLRKSRALYKKGKYYFLPRIKTNLKKFLVKSSNPFSSNLFVFANHSEAVNNRPRTIVTPQLVTKQVIMLVV